MAWKTTNPVMFRPLKKEIYWVTLGNPPKEVVGHEQAFTRPCLVVRSGHPSHVAIVIPITSKTPPSRHFAAVHLPEGIDDSGKDSYVLCFQVRAASYQRFGNKIGELNDDTYEEILTVLADYIGL